MIFPSSDSLDDEIVVGIVCAIAVIGILRCFLGNMHATFGIASLAMLFLSELKRSLDLNESVYPGIIGAVMLYFTITMLYHPMLQRRIVHLTVRIFLFVYSPAIIITGGARVNPQFAIGCTGIIIAIFRSKIVNDFT